MKIIVQPSTRRGKKWMAVFEDGHAVHFGLMGASDFTIHKDPERRLRYVNRHPSTRENHGKSGIRTPGFWAMNLLWNKPSLGASARDIEKRFHVKITFKRRGGMKMRGYNVKGRREGSQAIRESMIIQRKKTSEQRYKRSRESINGLKVMFVNVGNDKRLGRGSVQAACHNRDGPVHVSQISLKQFEEGLEIFLRENADIYLVCELCERNLNEIRLPGGYEMFVTPEDRGFEKILLRRIDKPIFEGLVTTLGGDLLYQNFSEEGTSILVVRTGLGGLREKLESAGRFEYDMVYESKFYAYVYRDIYNLDVGETIEGIGRPGARILRERWGYRLVDESGDRLGDDCVKKFAGYAVFNIGSQNLCVTIPHLMKEASEPSPQLNVSHKTQVDTIIAASGRSPNYIIIGDYNYPQVPYKSTVIHNNVGYKISDNMYCSLEVFDHAFDERVRASKSGTLTATESGDIVSSDPGIRGRIQVNFTFRPSVRTFVENAGGRLKFNPPLPQFRGRVEYNASDIRDNFAYTNHTPVLAQIFMRGHVPEAPSPEQKLINFLRERVPETRSYRVLKAGGKRALTQYNPGETIFHDFQHRGVRVSPFMYIRTERFRFMLASLRENSQMALASFVFRGDNIPTPVVGGRPSRFRDIMDVANQECRKRATKRFTDLFLKRLNKHSQNHDDEQMRRILDVTEYTNYSNAMREYAARQPELVEMFVNPFSFVSTPLEYEISLLTTNIINYQPVEDAYLSTPMSVHVDEMRKVLSEKAIEVLSMKIVAGGSPKDLNIHSIPLTTTETFWLMTGQRTPPKDDALRHALGTDFEKNLEIYHTLTK